MVLSSKKRVVGGDEGDDGEMDVADEDVTMSAVVVVVVVVVGGRKRDRADCTDRW